MKSSSFLLTDEEKARAEAFADSEVERINPRCRAAYRTTVLARVSAEIIEDRKLQEAFQARLLDSAVEKLADADVTLHAELGDGDRWFSDPVERQAARERGLLLARMEAEQGVDASW